MTSFIDPLRHRLTQALTQFNRDLPRNPHVHLSASAAHEDRRVFSVAPLIAQPEPQNLGRLKDLVSQRYGMLDLLDIILEADRLVDFTRFFPHSGTKEVRSRDALRPLLLLALFAEGTNTGSKRVATAHQRYGFHELLYVRKHYFSVDALRLANAAVVNKILALRNPHLWGEGHSCASDGKRFESWRQNLMTEWHVRYGKPGVMVYWHVERKSACIYSQLKTCSSSEVAAMIEGVLRHCTEMEIDKQYVDSHGQSAVAFAFCHLLGFQLLPRLKAIHRQRLYRPEAGQPEAYPHLQPVLSRPIRWDLIAQQYDPMVKYATALRLGTAETEAIRRRLTRQTVQHPTYRALIERGNARRTIFLCRYLRLLGLRREIQEGLNVIENWNSANDFILFGHGGEMATNRREDQELMMLTLHLLQNCLVFINTLLIQQVLKEPAWEQRLTADDRRGLTPLMYSHISPYGTFLLDMRTRLDLEQPEESAQAKPEDGAAPASGGVVRPPRRARAQVPQLGLFDAAPEPHH